MAELGESSSSPSPSQSKPVVVRVKRKSNQEPLDAFWLEINERPLKRALLDIEGLAISDSDRKVKEETKTKKLLVQHVETISSSKALNDVLESYLPNFGGTRDLGKKSEHRKSMFKQDKDRQQKQEHLRSTARQKHEELAKNARFEQIWKSRKEQVETGDASLREVCHLYDVVRVDDDGNSEQIQEPKHVSVEDNAILCNYLPLLRELIPSAADDILADMRSHAFGEDTVEDGTVEDGTDRGSSAITDYVYDVYTVEENMTEIDQEATTSYPLVQVDFEDDFFDGASVGSDYPTDDSNAEDNPRNDYPDDESSADEKDENRDLFDDYEDYDSQDERDSQYADEVVDSDQDNQEDGRWKHR